MCFCFCCAALGERRIDIMGHSGKEGTNEGRACAYVARVCACVWGHTIILKQMFVLLQEFLHFTHFNLFCSAITHAPSPARSHSALPPGLQIGVCCGSAFCGATNFFGCSSCSCCPKLAATIQARFQCLQLLHARERCILKRVSAVCCSTHSVSCVELGFVVCKHCL